jgi:hypothetical protein
MLLDCFHPFDDARRVLLDGHEHTSGHTSYLPDMAIEDKWSIGNDAILE